MHFKNASNQLMISHRILLTQVGLLLQVMSCTLITPGGGGSTQGGGELGEGRDCDRCSHQGCLKAHWPQYQY